MDQEEETLESLKSNEKDDNGKGEVHVYQTRKRNQTQEVSS